MKKFVKALLFSMLLFIATNVKAMDDIIVRPTDIVEDGYDLSPINVKKANGNYAFCLDKDYLFVDDGKKFRDFRIDGYGITDISESKIRNVLLKAYVDGLGTGSNIYNLNEQEFYIVTQMAIWHAMNG